MYLRKKFITFVRLIQKNNQPCKYYELKFKYKTINQI